MIINLVIKLIRGIGNLFPGKKPVTTIVHSDKTAPEPVVQNTITIVAPGDEAQGHSNAPRELADLFITQLLKSRASPITFSIYLGTNHVECNDPNLKNLLTLLLKSHQLEAMVSQISPILHKTLHNEQNPEVNKIILMLSGKEIHYEVIEIKPLPNLTWKVNKIESLQVSH